MTLLHSLFGLHRHKQSQVYGTQETTPGSPNENGVYGLVKNMINDEGASLVLGDVVKGNGDGTVEKTETLNDPEVMGVVAAAGPFADGSPVPVLLAGWHPAVKITGAGAANDYVTSSATDGTAEVQSPGAKGAFARLTAAAAGGTAPAIVFQVELGGDVDEFTDLLDVPSAYTGEGLKTLRVKATEDGIEFVDPAASAFTDLTDVPASYSGHGGEAVRVAGTEDALEFVTFPSSGSIEYDPLRAPSSPASENDEFDDLSLAGAWTTFSSGGGSSGTIDETLRKGFLRIPVTDGGAGSGRGVYKTFSPGSNLVTFVAHVFGNVRNHSSAQARIALGTSGGSEVYGLGMLGGALFIVFDTGGFSTWSVPYVSTNTGETWLMIRRDTGTNYDSYVSHDGHIWTRLTGATRTGTIDRAYVECYAFGSTQTEAWWDFVRFFAATTFDVGGTP